LLSFQKQELIVEKLGEFYEEKLSAELERIDQELDGDWDDSHSEASQTRKNLKLSEDESKNSEKKRKKEFL